ncbi:MAG: serine/threonine protein kinase [Thermoguttaceae bacterium]|nr:serine/threonine protein kinase [Thermoguttaceae bacterium]
MAELSVDDLTQRLLSLDLMDMGKIRDVENSFGSQNFTSEQFLQAAQRLGYLTKYQVERLASGETTGFYYGDYRIQYMIGSGSFARVFRCVHKTTGKVVAVKVLRARFREDKTAIDEFTREAELGVELRHPNVAAVYESKSTKYDHYMVMDFIEGRTLREEVKAQKNGIVEPKRATRIVTDVCSALDYAFKRGYQHRDMKLSNIMLSSSGKAVLLDFGLLADDNNSNWKNQRAIEYAALERTTRVRRDDKRSDVYFLGAIFYQLLTGVAPLGEMKERAKRLDSSRFRNVRPIRDVAPFVPRVLAFIVEKAMKLDPEERYQSPGAMLADLEIAVKKLESGEVDEEVAVQTSLAAAAKKERANLPTVMIVEANVELQNTFRQSFKNAGFRALVISNVDRAIERLDDPDSGVGAVLFNAQALGKAAVEGFNRLLESPTTRDIPAVLLLDETQVKWAAKARRSKTRLAIGMPIAMKRLLLVLMKLTAPQLFEETPATPAEPEKTPVATSEAKPEPVDETVETSTNAEESDFPSDEFDAALDAAVDALEPATAEPELSAEPDDDYYGDYEDYENDDEEK